MGFKEKIKDFFFGRLKTEDIEISHATATVTLDDDSKHEITRCGYVAFFRKPYHVSGKALLLSYMDSGKSMLITDMGDIIPVCKIKNVTFEITSEVVTETWR